MWRATQFVFIGTLCVMVLGYPTELDETFAEYLRSVNKLYPEKQTQIVKRRIYEGDTEDLSHKKLPLQLLIGDLEQQFFQSASLMKSPVHQSGEPAETNPFSESHPEIKRKIGNAEQDVDKTTTAVEATTTTTTEIIETSTMNISTNEFGSTRIQIEDISLQPHFGDLPVIPIFEVPQKNVGGSLNASDSSSDSIQKSITTITIPENSKNSKEHEETNKAIKHKPNNQTEVYLDSIGHTTTEQPEVLDKTSQKPKKGETKSAAELKESEAELKEKVAEIEAEPVILSARV